MTNDPRRGDVPALASAALRLRPLSPADDPHIISWVPDAHALRLWVGPGLDYPLDSAQLDRYREVHDNPSTRLFTAVDSDRTPVGQIGLRNINPKAGFARVVFVLIDPAQRGGGLGPRMVDAVLAIGFDEIGLHRIDLSVFDFNTRAIRCYEKCGFVREGLAREAIRAGDGSYWNMVSMAILEQEWKDKRAVS